LKHFSNPDSLLPTSSEHSLGVASGKQESWEFDSGARDLSSPEPSTLYKLIEAAGVSLVAGGTCPSHILDLANRVSSLFGLSRVSF